MALKKQEAARQGRSDFYEYGDPSGLTPEQQSAIANPVQGPVNQTPVDYGVAQQDQLQGAQGPALPMVQEEGPKLEPVLQYFKDFAKQFPRGLKGQDALTKMDKAQGDGNTQWLTKEEIKARGGITQPGEKMYPGETSRGMMRTLTDPSTGESYLVNVETNEAKPIGFPGDRQPAKANPLQAKLNPKEYKMYEKDRNDFDNDVVVKADRMALSLLHNMETELANYNAALTPVLRSQAARAIAKEVGVLTEGDIGRQFDPSVIAKLRRFATVAATGKLPESDLKDMKDLIVAMKSGSEHRINTVARDMATRLSNNVGGKVSADEFLKNIDLPTSFGPGIKVGGGAETGGGGWKYLGSKQ